LILPSMDETSSGRGAILGIEKCAGVFCELEIFQRSVERAERRKKERRRQLLRFEA
jgi:hypothetical protein